MDWERTRMRAENMASFGEDAATRWAGETILKLLDMATQTTDIRILDELWKDGKVKTVPLLHSPDGEIRVYLETFDGDPRKYRWMLFAVKPEDMVEKSIEMQRRRVEALGDSPAYRMKGRGEKNSEGTSCDQPRGRNPVNHDAFNGMPG